MADFVETLISKRRNRSSNSSTNDSPDTKKSMSHSAQHRVEGEGEPPLAASIIMPSEDIQETLREILEKFGKLDIIEN